MHTGLLTRRTKTITATENDFSVGRTQIERLLGLGPLNPGPSPHFYKPASNVNAALLAFKGSGGWTQSGDDGAIEAGGVIRNAQVKKLK